MIAAVEQLKAELHDQPAIPLRPGQIAEYNGELERLGVMVEGRDQDGVPRDWLKGASGAARRRAQHIKKVLAEQSPKRVTGERASRINRLTQQVIAEIQPALLPRSSMRRNPPGAVGHVLRTEFHSGFKDAVLTVKRALWALDPDNSDPDYTNMERFRREAVGTDGTATFMADAQIPGHLAFGPTAKANWPLGEATADTALKQAQRQNGKATPAKRPRRPATQAQLEALARARAARAAAKGGAA